MKQLGSVRTVVDVMALLLALVVNISHVLSVMTLVAFLKNSGGLQDISVAVRISCSAARNQLLLLSF